MDDQLVLGADTPGKVRRDHRGTAHEAAAVVKTGTIRFAVLRRIIGASRTVTFGPTEYGITDESLADDLRRSENTVRPRRVECVQAGWVEDSGKTHPSRWGRQMTVWRATDEGVRVYREAGGQ